MGFLKSIGKAFVEEVPTEETSDYSEMSYSEEPEEVEANLDEVNVNTLIDDIYAQNDLTEMSESIFKVEEVINSLPKEMATDAKRQTVQSILSSFGLTVSEVVSDGEKRVEIVKAVKKTICEDGESNVSDMEASIEQHKIEIAELQKKIAAVKEEVKTSSELIDSEAERINGLIKFIGGE